MKSVRDTVYQWLQLKRQLLQELRKAESNSKFLFDSDMAYDLKSGKTVSIQRMLAVNHVIQTPKKETRQDLLNW